MWPWEHVAFGYLAYSAYAHAVDGDSPGDAAAVAVAFGSVLPDLVDKPLSWTFGLFPSGYSVAHSVFVAPWLAGAVWLAARRMDRGRVGAAFAVAYASHLVGDVTYPLVEGEGLAPAAVLWPVVTLPPYETRRGLVERFLVYFHAYAERLLALDFGPLLAFEVTLALCVVAVWLADGAPGVGLLRRSNGDARRATGDSRRP